MSLQTSPHEEWGQHTVLYCSACHRETFEAWHKEQEVNRTGKWTGTECLVCQEILERIDWFDEPDIGGTCTLECHMVWQIYKKVLKGQNIYMAANTIANRYQGYPFCEEENIRKIELMVQKDQGFHWPMDEYIWKWKMTPSWKKGEHWSIDWYN